MSRRRDIERHLQSLGEVKEIMGAMKNLALIQTHRLSRLLSTQQRVLKNIEASASDFLVSYPQLLSPPLLRNEVWVLVGSERGFCGDFNDALSKALASQRSNVRPDSSLFIVGSKLSFKFVGDVKIAATLKGPNTLEEVPRALLRLMQRLTDWQHQAQKETRPLRITVFHHDYETAQVQSIVLDPLARPLPIEPRHRHAPLLNLEPRQLLERLTEHYLFAALHQILYSSLMAENQRRIQHMDRAVRRIEQQSALLQRRLNSLRQEEITEEIEVIMLSTEILTR